MIFSGFVIAPLEYGRAANILEVCSAILVFHFILEHTDLHFSWSFLLLFHTIANAEWKLQNSVKKNPNNQARNWQIKFKTNLFC